MQWITKKTQHVDQETGEILNEEILNEYIKIITHKKYQVNEKNTRGTIQHITEWKRRKYKQSEFKFD